MVHAEIAARLHRPEERRLLGLHPAECSGIQHLYMDNERVGVE